MVGQGWEEEGGEVGRGEEGGKGWRGGGKGQMFF